MSFKVPSFDDLHSFLIAFWKGSFPGSNVGSRFTYHWKRLRVYAAAVTDLHAHIDSAQRDVMPDTSTGSFLTRWGGILKILKKSATPARGSKVLRVYGTLASTVLIGDQLVHLPTGLIFQITENAAIPAGLYIDVDLAGVSTGSATRLLAGESLTFSASIAGITAIAKLVGDLNQDGFDDEQDPAYSVRVNDEFGKPRMGGHESDFEKWALEVDGVSMARAYPNRAGIGTMDIACFHTANGTARSLTLAERAIVLAHIQTVAPAQVAAVGGALRVLETDADPQSIEITVIPNGDLAYDFDWDDSTPLVVLAYTPATLSVQFTAPIPTSILAAMRIVFRGVASAQDGRVFTIEAVTAADTVTLRETPAADLAATDIGYSGGPLTAMIRDAIIAHMNGEIIYADSGAPLAASVAGSKVGLQILADALGPANPAGIYGSWSGSLIRATLSRIASYPTGARNVSVITPAADYDATDPAFPNDSKINFITPNAALVRKG